MKLCLSKQIKAFLMISAFFLVCSCSKKQNETDAPTNPPDSGNGTTTASDISLWLTLPDKSFLLSKQNTSINFVTTSNGNPVISVDTTQQFQEIDGFGFALTGGSATLINQLPSSLRTAVLKELFSTDSTAIGISYLRISIGASDLSSEVFTYDDLAAGQTDDNLQLFSLAREQQDLIPVLKDILKINPAIKILATPWTAPSWMKTNASFRGGSLKPEYYDVYARYFVKYIQGMQEEGISIDAITPQNEPLNPDNNPSMVMSASEQASFIKNNLGPAFRSAHLSTKIIIYDHNADNPTYPMSILADANANPYIDGSAFHLYAGNISALTLLKTAYPEKNLYFTEQYTAGTGSFSGDLAWHINNVIIGATRNWSRNVLEWNLASDPNLGPHTQGGCTSCLGALTIDQSVTRNVSYYIIAHASKFVKPGSIRIGSTIPDNLQNVAFKTPEGKKILIVINNGSYAAYFNIEFNGKYAATSLPAGAVGTYVW